MYKHNTRVNGQAKGWIFKHTTLADSPGYIETNSYVGESNLQARLQRFSLYSIILRVQWLDMQLISASKMGRSSAQN